MALKDWNRPEKKDSWAIFFPKKDDKTGLLVWKFQNDEWHTDKIEVDKGSKNLKIFKTKSQALKYAKKLREVM